MKVRQWIVPAMSAAFAIAAMVFDQYALWLPALLMFIPWVLLRIWALRAEAWKP